MATRGWHDDPLGTHRWRWHDGNGWTDHVYDDEGPANQQPDMGLPQPPPHTSAAPVGGTLPTVVPAALRGRTRQLVIVGVAMAAIAAVVLVVTVTRSYSIEGTFTLMDSDGYTGSGLGCSGTGGYSDIGSGTPVTVRTGDGTIVGSSSLGTGEDTGLWCEFEFTVDDVDRAEFYEIEVGRRGALSYSFDEMERNDWTVSFTLGD